MNKIFQLLIVTLIWLLTAVSAYAGPLVWPNDFFDDEGQMVTSNIQGQPARIAKGTDGQVLTVGPNGYPSFQTPATSVSSIGTINSQTKSANGAVISGSSLVMQTAGASLPGLCIATGTANQLLGTNNAATAHENKAITATAAGALTTAQGITATTGNIVASAGNLTATTGNLTFGAASANIIPGATSLLFRNNANSATNLSITNAGVVAFPSANYTASRPISLDASKNIVNTAYALTDANYATATWTDFSGTINVAAGSGGGSVGSTSINYAQQMKIGKLVHIAFSFSTTISGANLDYIAVTLPFTGRNNGAFSQDTGGIVIGNSDVGQIRVQSGSTQGRIYSRNLAQFTTGTQTYSGNFIYVEN